MFRRSVYVLMLLVFSCLILVISYAWGSIPSDKKEVVVKPVIQENLNNRILNLEKEQTDAKLRDSIIRDKIQQDENYFYHSAMTYFNIVITAIAVVITLAVAIAGGYVLYVYRNVKKNVANAHTELNNLKEDANNLKGEMDEHIKKIGNQTKALNEFSLGRDIITNIETDEKTIEFTVIPSFQKCMELWPEFDLASFYLGLAYKQIGTFDKAYEYLEAYSNRTGLTFAGSAHLYESAILIENRDSVDKMDKKYSEQLSNFGGGRFMPFMEALIQFSRKNGEKVAEIIRVQQEEILADSKHDKRKHLHWSFGPAKLFLEKKKSYDGYDLMIKHIDLLDGVICCEVDPDNETSG